MTAENTISLLVHTCKKGHRWVSTEGMTVRFFSSINERGVLNPDETHSLEAKPLCPHCLVEFLSENFGAVRSYRTGESTSPLSRILVSDGEGSS